MTSTTPERNEALVLEAFDTLFNKRDGTSDDVDASHHFEQLASQMRRNSAAA
jgi:hypothetical protein